MAKAKVYSVLRRNKVARRLGRRPIWLIRLLLRREGPIRLLLQGKEGRHRAKRRLGLYLLRAEAETLRFRRDGVDWSIPVSDSKISRMLFETGGFHHDELLGLLRWLESNNYLTIDKDLIIDIGANIGTTTIPLALETDRRVLAIEPDPNNFHHLQLNVAHNHLGARVSCLQDAVSNQPGRVRMIVNPGSAGNTEILEEGATHAQGPVIEVEANTLDDILHEHQISADQVALVWSDTEGFERQVIESGRSLWSAGVPLYVEVWSPGLSRHGGMEQFVRMVEENFEHMVPGPDLESQQVRALARPVSRLRDYVDHVPYSNVLLLPGRRA
jgi:FkbM family methyltransferase